MSFKCSVIGCPSKPEGLTTFHRFPIENQELLATWMETIKVKGKPSEASRICSLHFKIEDFHKDAEHWELSEGAVPFRLQVRVEA